MSSTGVAPGYLHGFNESEQNRLYDQAQFLAESVYAGVDFSNCPELLEVGCGVGAQTEILLGKFPKIKITGVDASEVQIKKATEHLSQAKFAENFSGRFHMLTGDALHLPFSEDRFDGAFLCWFLEHVQNPVGILQEVKRVLKPQAKIVCNEVLNATFYVHPYSPATLKYWMEFNDHQWNLKGDPFVGGKLANYLIQAGYQNITTQVITHHYDNRTPKKRAQFIGYWTTLLLSGAPELIKAGKIDAATVDEMKQELSRIQNDPDAVIFYSWVQAYAQAL